MTALAPSTGKAEDFDSLVDDVTFRPLLSVLLECNDKKQLTGRLDSRPAGVEGVRSNVTHYIKQRGNC